MGFDCKMIQQVRSFEELVATPFSPGINAVCWTRTLTGDFGEIVDRLGAGEGIVGLDEERLGTLDLSAAGRAAVEAMLADLRLLRAHGFSPELNCIHAYERDDESEAWPTDVHSFHADRASIPTETWLCTYHGAPSEGLRNAEARRRVDVPEIRAELRRRFGEGDEEEFAQFLQESCHDLHYLPLPHAQPYSFGVGNLWRIAVEHPDSPAPPCIHRAPLPQRGQSPRLLLIS